jgi:hypothetical protein
MTADLGEEHSAATLATERLENEQAERMKLQKDNSELQVKFLFMKLYQLLLLSNISHS